MAEARTGHEEEACGRYDFQGWKADAIATADRKSVV